MGGLNFNSELIQVIAEHRTPLATVFFQLFTWLGEIEGYIFVVAAIYAAVDKRLAFRLAMLALATMSINHVMKTIIANPRPFVAEGSLSQYWAVSEGKLAELAAEYSTPSGHAMAGGSFYTFLYASVTSPRVRFLAVAALLLTEFHAPIWAFTTSRIFCSAGLLESRSRWLLCVSAIASVTCGSGCRPPRRRRPSSCSVRS
jgi:membrane-associated phospholipid phosphatase